MNNNAFISGSQCYGKPHEGSDVDLVIKTDESTAMFLGTIFPSDECSDTVRGSISIRADKLNLIVCWEEKAYQVWLNGTQQLWQKRPVTREEAMATFDILRGIVRDPANKLAPPAGKRYDIPF